MVGGRATGCYLAAFESPPGRFECVIARSLECKYCRPRRDVVCPSTNDSSLQRSSCRSVVCRGSHGLVGKLVIDVRKGESSPTCNAGWWGARGGCRIWHRGPPGRRESEWFSRNWNERLRA